MIMVHEMHQNLLMYYMAFHGILWDVTIHMYHKYPIVVIVVPNGQTNVTYIAYIFHILLMLVDKNFEQ